MGFWVYEELQKLLLAMVQCRKGIVEQFIECLLINPFLWQAADNSSFCMKIKEVIKFIKYYPKIMNERQIVDLLFNAMQGYIKLDPIRHQGVINTLWNIARSFIRGKVTYSMVLAILGYANCNYLRELPNYPILLWYSLKALTELYVSERKALMHVLRKEMELNKDSIMLSVLFSTLLYIIDCMELGGCERSESISKYDETMIQCCKAKQRTTDQILGMCIYMILEFDWRSLAATAHEMPRPDSTVQHGKLDARVEESLVSFFMRQLTQVKGLSEFDLLSFILSRAKSCKLGKSSAKAFVAVLLKQPEMIASELGLDIGVQASQIEEANSLKPELRDLLSFIMEQAALRFNRKARQELISALSKSPILMEAILDSRLSPHPFLKFSQDTESSLLSKIQAQVLNAFTPRCRCSLWKELAGSENHKLNVVDNWIDLVFEEIHAASNAVATNCLEIAYFIEHILETHFMSKGSQEFVIALSKFVLLLKKTGSLYMTVPTLRVVDDRSPLELSGKQKKEGGILRIVLKAVFVSVKLERLENSFDLLNYLLFGDKKSKAHIKIFMKQEISSYEKTKKNKMPNIIQLVMRDADTKYLQIVNKYYVKQIFSGESGMLSKTVSLEKSDKDFFQNPHCLLLYVITSLMQLAYFELFEVNNHSEFPQDENSLSAILNQYQNSSKTPSSHYKKLIAVIKALLMHGTKDEVITILTDEFEGYIKHVMNELVASSIPCLVPRLLSSQLDSVRVCRESELVETKERKEFWKGALTKFGSNWLTFVKNLLVLFTAEESFNSIIKMTVACLLESNAYFVVYPMLILLTNHGLVKLDACADNRVSVEEGLEYSESIVAELVDKIWSQTVSAAVTKSKFRRDEFRFNIDFMGERLYRKATKEQYSELGSWYKKAKSGYMSQLFEYVKRQYKKLSKREVWSSLNGFVEISLKRDKMGRCMKLKRSDKVEESCAGYEYLRIFILKKMMIKSCCKRGERFEQYYDQDFKFLLIRNLFKRSGTASNPANDSASPSGKTVENCEAKNYTMLPNKAAFTGSIPLKLHLFNAQMMTIKGMFAGKLMLTSATLSFRSMQGDFGNTAITHEANVMQTFKEWPLSAVKELLVKRHNLTEQCIEVYVDSWNSVLFSLASKGELRSLLARLEGVVRKQRYGLKVVRSPEKYFAAKGFSERWTKGEITNFEYLMLINKYSGRSFNDLNQYPVFPRVNKDYIISPLNFEGKRISLAMTIAGMVEEEKKQSTAKLKSPTNKSAPPFQSTIPHLPCHAVLNYLSRLQPYTSLFTFSRQCLHSIHSPWGSTCDKPDDGIIPEFYYLPELVCNANLCCFKLPAEGCSVELPPWAKSSHLLVQGNAMALESRYVSELLDQWIDLVFGYKQQDQRPYSLFKTVSEDIYKEAQTAGVNPTCIFTQKHPKRLEKNFKNIARYGIFNWYSDGWYSRENNEKEHAVDNKSFALLKLAELEKDQPVIFIESFAGLTLAITNSQRLYKSPDAHANEFAGRNTKAKEKETRLAPFKSYFDEVGKAYRECDSQRCFIAFGGGTRLASCRHYDNSWKMSNCATGEVENSVHFHNHIVNCIYATESKVFTASSDGLVAMWQLPLTSPHPAWSLANGHNPTSLDVSAELGLVAVAARSAISLRRICSGRLVQVIRVGNVGVVSLVRVSCRGYVVAVVKPEKHSAKMRDSLLVYSINGELIGRKETKDWITSIVVSETGYEFIAGGKAGKVMKYELLTLKARNLLEDIEEAASLKLSITAMNLAKSEGHQSLLIGTSTGMLYALKIDPQLL